MHDQIRLGARRTGPFSLRREEVRHVFCMVVRGGLKGCKNGGDHSAERKVLREHGGPQSFLKYLLVFILNHTGSQVI